ncbi:MAG: hypothetical protein IT337_12630 [Thermomicrobiales bacterium]|nr:hypothetical protein [Thermomicrobiales bacterium]
MAEPSDNRASPFPLRATPAVRVDSVAEEHAYLAAYPASSGAWRATGQTLMIGKEGPEDHLTARAPAGETVVVRFAIGSFFGHEPDPFAQPGAALDQTLQRAAAWAQEHEPGHPGALPRFPVPAAGYPGRVAVHFAVRAMDDAHRPGLYGPTRAVVLGFPEGEVVGGVDGPGFDPAAWPPARLGDWPPPGLAELDRPRLSGMVGRFSALWTRLLTAFLAGTDYPQRRDEAAEARALLRRLDPPGMLAAYRAMHERFWDWLEA